MSGIRRMLRSRNAYDATSRERPPMTATAYHQPSIPRLNSRMLDAYVTCITELLDEELWSEAARMAAGLPHIAVALTDRELQSSPEAYRARCAEWVSAAAGDA